MALPGNASLGPQMSQLLSPTTQYVVTPTSAIADSVPATMPAFGAGGGGPQYQAQPYTHTVPLNQAPTTISGQNRKRWWSRNQPPPISGYRDPWYSKAVEEYPAGYPSLAAYMSDDIDGRIYRRFSYLRNRLLLFMQDRLNALEQALEDVDQDDEEKAKNGEAEALFRLISRRYNEQTVITPSSAPNQQCACCCVHKGNDAASQPATPSIDQQSATGRAHQTTNGPNISGFLQSKNNATKRMEILKDVEETLEKYDELLLREHEILSIRESTTKQRRSLANFIWNGKPVGPGKNKKPLASQENKLIYRKDDSILLGTQEDAWLGTAAESMKRLMPAILRRYLLATRDDREKSKMSKTEYLSNDRVNNFVKAVVSVASTILLVLPIVILYALSTNGASGWLKIGILLVFVVAFALALSVLTNASRSEMFGASAGYTAVLIVFLTFGT